MRKGRLIQVMKDGLHPQEAARKARETVAAVALACSNSPEEAVDKLELAGVVTRKELALGSLRSLRERLDQQAQRGLINAYLHVTYACNLSCTHCYAEAGPGKSPTMQPDQLRKLGRECAMAGFRKIVITGGEPLAHSDQEEVLETLALLCQEIKPTQIALRTNLAYQLDEKLIGKMGKAADQIVVSLDGDEATHDARRGAGSYTRTVANLHRMLEKAQAGQLLLTAVLPASQIEGTPGQSVRELGRELGVKVRFKSVLPLGRGQTLKLEPTYYTSMEDGACALANSSGPTSTCGLGMNLYIDPRGECFPCYAVMGREHRLGNALEDGLPAVLAKNNAYRKVTVDSNEQCCTCALRYLCGGFCRAWSTDGPNAAPRDCVSLQERAHSLLVGAMETLEIEMEQWMAAGLPLEENSHGTL